MTEVTDVIVARRNEPDQFNRMVGWSVGVHVGVLGLILVGAIDLGFDEVEPPRTVMTVSLAGAPGPRTGNTPMAGRAVPTPPPEPVPAPRPAPPPPPRPAEALPTPRERPQPRQQPQPAPAQPSQDGATRTDTGARGRGFGLATGGGGGSGVQLDVANFCCPEYLQQMIGLIQQNWMPNQGIAGTVVMRFTITRSGLIQDIQQQRGSGFVALDLAAQQALQRSRLPELPLQFPNPTLTVNITFEYQR